MEIYNGTTMVRWYKTKNQALLRGIWVSVREGRCLRFGRGVLANLDQSRCIQEVIVGP